MSGWVKLHRKLQQWGWKKSPNHVAVFIDLILEANHEEREHLGTKVSRGSLTTSIKAISTRTGVTEKSVRTVLTHLAQTNEVAIKTTSKFTMISILNWSEHQSSGEVTGKQLANHGQTTGKPRATNKNSRIKELKNNTPGLFEVEPLQLETDVEASHDAVTVLTLLNSICFRSFRPTEFNLKFINARLKEEYSLEDFKKVINYKNKEWGAKSDMKEYLQPSTLFGNKFDQYLNQALGSETISQAEEDALIAQYFPGA